MDKCGLIDVHQIRTVPKSFPELPLASELNGNVQQSEPFRHVIESKPFLAWIVCQAQRTGLALFPGTRPKSSATAAATRLLSSDIDIVKFAFCRISSDQTSPFRVPKNVLFMWSTCLYTKIHAVRRFVYVTFYFYRLDVKISLYRSPEIKFLYC